MKELENRASSSNAALGVKKLTEITAATAAKSFLLKLTRCCPDDGREECASPADGRDSTFPVRRF